MGNASTEKTKRKRERQRLADPVAFNRKMSDRKKRYLKRHPEARRAAQKRSNVKWAPLIRRVNRERREWARAGRIWWVLTHPKECQAWVGRGLEAKRLARRNRKALERGAVGRMSKGLYSRLFALQQGKCVVCREKVEKMDLDHIIPLAGGGSNEDSNIQLLCPPCNVAKSAHHPIKFMQSRGFLL